MGESWTTIVENGYTCYYYADCPEMGQLCLWDVLSHQIDEVMTKEAWTYLTSTIPTTLGPATLSPTKSNTGKKKKNVKKTKKNQKKKKPPITKKKKKKKKKKK